VTFVFSVKCTNALLTYISLPVRSQAIVKVVFHSIRAKIKNDDLFLSQNVAVLIAFSCCPAYDCITQFFYFFPFCARRYCKARRADIGYFCQSVCMSHLRRQVLCNTAFCVINIVQRPHYTQHRPRVTIKWTTKAKPQVLSTHCDRVASYWH